LSLKKPESGDCSKGWFNFNYVSVRINNLIKGLSLKCFCISYFHNKR
jgi:hypothetical protein